MNQQHTLKMARPARFEHATTRFVVWDSIQLSYGRTAMAMANHYQMFVSHVESIIQTTPVGYKKEKTFFQITSSFILKDDCVMQCKGILQYYLVFVFLAFFCDSSQILVFYQEGWVSGLNQQFAKLSYGLSPYREFESLPLRQFERIHGKK